MSRQFVKAGKKKLVELIERRFEDRAILAICMETASSSTVCRHILAAIGVENDVKKYLFDGAFVSGSSENAEAVKDLLNKPDRKRAGDRPGISVRDRWLRGVALR